jgi:hypothetical protein
VAYGLIMFQHLSEKLPFNGFSFRNGDFKGFVTENTMPKIDETHERLCRTFTLYTENVQAYSTWVGYEYSSTGWETILVSSSYTVTECEETSYNGSIYGDWERFINNYYVYWNYIISQVLGGVGNVQPSGPSTPNPPTTPLNCECQHISLEGPPRADASG